MPAGGGTVFTTYSTIRKDIFYASCPKILRLRNRKRNRRQQRQQRIRSAFRPFCLKATSRYYWFLAFGIANVPCTPCSRLCYPGVIGQCQFPSGNSHARSSKNQGW